VVPKTLQRVDVDKYIDPDADFQTGWWLQYTTLTSRNYKRQKQRYISKLLYGQMLFIAIAGGLVWFDMPRTEETVRDRLGMVIMQNCVLIIIMSLCPVTCPSRTSDRWKLALINSLSHHEQTLNGHVVDCYIVTVLLGCGLWVLLNTFTGTKAWVKRSDFRTFGLSNLQTIDTEPCQSRYK